MFSIKKNENRNNNNNNIKNSINNFSKNSKLILIFKNIWNVALQERYAKKLKFSYIKLQIIKLINKNYKLLI